MHKHGIWTVIIIISSSSGIKSYTDSLQAHKKRSLTGKPIPCRPTPTTAIQLLKSYIYPLLYTVTQNV